MAPPAKRRKRNIIPSSPGEDETITNSKTGLNALVSSSPASSSELATEVSRDLPRQLRTAPAKLHTGSKVAVHSSNATATNLPKQIRGSKKHSKTPSVSPEKSKRKGKSEEVGKSADLFTFFTKQVQRQQAEGGGDGAIPKQKGLTTRSKDSVLEDHDIISDEDDVVEGEAKASSLVGWAARKRAKGTDTFQNGDRNVPSGNQKFVKGPNILGEVRFEDDTRPWAERFAPVNLEELAVHKKKVADVRAWLDGVINGRMRQRLLILKGAAGTGKTTTVQLLAKAMDCDVLEWRNPVGSVATADGNQSIAAQFEDFMGRGGTFGQLDMFSGGKGQSNTGIKPLDRRKQFLLVEEFPNTFTRSSTALKAFRSTIIQYLAANMPSLSMACNYNKKENITPVVMIISETLLTTTSAIADSFTAHRLLGPEILQHPGTGTIEFNAIAPTLLAKALEVIVQKESRKSGRRKTPGPLVLKRLGDIGDIRSAVGSLEFLCLRGDIDGDWGAKVAFSKVRKGSKDAVTLTKMEEESLELVTRREASLGIFHAVGKVVYNKRLESVTAPSPGLDVEQLPEFLAQHARHERSMVSVDELIDETGTDTQTFVAALHENYLLSCDASPSSSISSLDHVNGCIDALSDSDLLCPSWDGSFNSGGFGGGIGGQGSGGDIVRQDEISFQIAVRGILFSLPNPVKRRAPAAAGLRTGRGGDAFKMFYPTSLKLWRLKEEIEASIDLWVTKLMKGEVTKFSTVTSGASSFARTTPGVVESWKQAASGNLPNARHINTKEVTAVPLMSIGTSAKKEMLLERLPYMVFIAKTWASSVSALAIRDMEKVTSFCGIGGPSDDSPDEVDETTVVAEDWATDKPVEITTPRKKRLAIRGKGIGSGLHVQQQDQKLVLSDDDIEDH